MDYIREYKSFINSYYLTEGLRITAGVALPVICLGYLDLQAVGMIVSLGAICTSAADSPGPIHHRRNGMLACIGAVSILAMITGLLAPYPIALGALVAVACFLCSMIGVYGNRVNSIGVAALIVMVLSMGRAGRGVDVFHHAAYVAAGGIWYMLFSMLIYHVRPYKLIQQALGDCIIATADYFRIRARLYDAGASTETIFTELLEQQVNVHHKQSLVRELLFKSRRLVKDSTATGRTLMMIFTDTVDLFEKATTSFYSYEKLHLQFDGEDILSRFKKVILVIAEELDDIGIAVQSGRALKRSEELALELHQLQEYFNAFADRHRRPENLEALITLRKILQAVEDVMERLAAVRHYTRYDEKMLRPIQPVENYNRFVDHTDIDWKGFRDNLSFKSNVFRHSLRVCIAGIAGYLVSNLLPLGHSYWILLTIIVILKPAYSLTQKRNYQRLIGTAAGALLGVTILLAIQDRTALFIIMLLLMVGTYSFLRMNYLVSVVFMTPYILLVFHFLDSTPLNTIVRDRVIDTAIGSAIAFVANLLLVPSWERDQIRNYMSESLKTSLQWYLTVAKSFTGTPAPELEYKLNRKNAFVALANLSEAFSRMLAEPERKRKNSAQVHPFVVQNHALNGHIATLADVGRRLDAASSLPDVKLIIDRTVRDMNDAITILDNRQPSGGAADPGPATLSFEEKLNELLTLRSKELMEGRIDTSTRGQLTALKPVVDQFRYISTIAEDMRRVSEQQPVAD